MSKSKFKTHSNYRPTANDVELRFRKSGIYVVNDDDTRTRIADAILVTAFATSDPGMAHEQAFTRIRFLNRRRKWKTRIVPSSMLTAQSHEFISLLSRLGYVWPPNKKLWPRIISALSIARPGRHIRVTPVPGWHGKFFALPGESYGPSGPDRKKTPDRLQSHCAHWRIPTRRVTRRVETIRRKKMRAFHARATGRRGQLRCAQLADPGAEQFRLQF
jgi:uncharacterized protein DUF927